MGKNSDIQWTDHTWNPWQGCHKVSSGCRNCYMERDMKRFDKPADVVRLSAPETFRMPYRLPREPAKVFVCSWSDFFIEEADGWRPAAWHIIKNCPHLTFQILTKRPERIAPSLPADWGAGYPNVWGGVTVENNDYRERAWELLKLPFAVRFISVEPMLGPVDVDEYELLCREWRRGATIGIYLDWVICGGESGPDARPIHPDWVRSLRDQCVAAGVPFFFKQWGEWMPHDGSWDEPHRKAIVALDGKVREPFHGRGLGFEREGQLMVRLGKKAAGHLLDDREWNQLPEVLHRE